MSGSGIGSPPSNHFILCGRAANPAPFWLDDALALPTRKDEGAATQSTPPSNEPASSEDPFERLYQDAFLDRIARHSSQERPERSVGSRRRFEMRLARRYAMGTATAEEERLLFERMKHDSWLAHHVERQAEMLNGILPQK